MTVAGFGRFARTEGPARKERNPRTGVAIAIGPSAGVSFKAADALKDARDIPVWTSEPRERILSSHLQKS